MKDKLYAGMQTFSRSIIKPVMFMAVAGIVIAISAVLRLDFMPLSLSDICLLYTSPSPRDRG